MSLARGRQRFAATALIAVVFGVVLVKEAAALIMGGEGNAAVADPGWPKGAAAVFNVPGRVAWWEGPPFGGGQWHAECRGNAQALSAVLADFAKVDAKTKRVVLHDGEGHSFWLAALQNDPKAKKRDTRVDWVVMVWQRASWEHLRQLPADINPTDPADAETGPPAEVETVGGGAAAGMSSSPPGLTIRRRRRLKPTVSLWPTVSCWKGRSST